MFGVAATLLTAVLTVLPPERASAAGADRPAAVSPKTPRIHTSQAAAGTASERRARTPPVPAPPEFTFAPPPLGQVGIAYSTPLTVSGGTSPFTWSIVAGSLPPGITLEAGTGLLSGTPTAADHYTFTVRLVDALEQTISRTVALDVTAAPVFTFPAPPAGQEGLLYGASLTVSGGTAPFTWSASAGSPPPGLGLDPQTGRLSGTPSAAGSYPFTVTVTDDAGLTDTRPVSLVISAGPLIVLHTADVSTVPVGGIVHLTTRVTNTSAVPFTSVTVRDTLVDLLDDATYNGDASATTGTVAYVSQTLTWTGDLPAGAVVTISYSVTVASPPGGDLTLTAVADSPTLGTNCAPGAADPRCTAVVEVSTLDLLKAASVTTAAPGSIVRYTITVRNTGAEADPGAGFTDSLTGVLDDATYSADARATSGTVTVSGGAVLWSGAIAAGATVTVRYSVRILSSGSGDGTLTNAVVAEGSNCPSDSCTTTVAVLRPELTLTNTADAVAVAPGTKVTYRFTISNTGQAAYPNAVVKISLAGIAAHATYNDDASADAGDVSATGALELTWAGSVSVGAVIEGVFSVTVTDPVTGGIRVITTALSSTAAGNNCAQGSTDRRCTARTTIATPSLTIVKTADNLHPTYGSVVRYRIVVTNTGQLPYTGATFDDSLVDVIDDGEYGNELATAGTVSFDGATLSWTGDLGVGEVAVITYTITVNSSGGGNQVLTDRATSTTAAVNCPALSPDPRCVLVITVRQPLLTINAVADVPTTTPGSVITFTATIANTGATAYPAATVTGSLDGVLDDALDNRDVATDLGAVSLVGTTLTWRGRLAVGAAATVHFSVTVRNPASGDHSVSAAFFSAEVGSNCPVSQPAGECAATVAVLLPQLTIVKTADSGVMSPTGSVVYTITVTNSGATDYPAATFTDTLTGALDDATYNDDATSSIGPLSYVSPALTWSGALAVGASATITYTMTVLDPDPGDRVMVGTVVSGSPGSTCPAAGARPDCTTSVRVTVPNVVIAMTATPPVAGPSSTVLYTVTVTNVGDMSTSAGFVVDLTGTLDDASYDNNAVGVPGSFIFASPYLYWFGSLMPDETATGTFSVTMLVPASGDHWVAAQLVSNSAASNCSPDAGDPRCSVNEPVAELVIETTGGAGVAVPGSVLAFTSTYTNAGQFGYAGVSVTTLGFGAAASGNGDLSATSGRLTAGPDGPVWTGDLAPGQTVTVTGTVTVLDGAPGPISATSVSATPGSNCPSNSADPRCGFTATVDSPTLDVSLTAQPATVAPGATVHYTLTATNGGSQSIEGVTVSAELADILDEAIYLADVDASSGIARVVNQAVVWSGTVPANSGLTITFSVTVYVSGFTNRVLIGTATADAAGSTCSATRHTGVCTSSVPILARGLSVTTTANPKTPLDGDTVAYVLAIVNTGGVDYPGISVVADLTGVVDDTGDPTGLTSNGVGLVTFTSPLITWSGDVPAGSSVTINYSVNVQPPRGGDRILTSTVSTDADDANCPPGSGNPRCTLSLPVVDTVGIAFTQTTDVSSALVGTVVTYTIVAANNTSGNYEELTFVDSLADILPHATYNNDASAQPSGVLSYVDPSLTWTGDLAAGSTVVVTFSVTVADLSSPSMTSTVASSWPGTNCAPGSVDPRCSATVSLYALTVTGQVDQSTVAPGAEITFGTTITYSGGATIFGFTATIDDTGVLDDATLTGLAVSSGTVTAVPAGWQWSGDLVSDTAVTISRTYRVSDPDPADNVLSSEFSAASLPFTCVLDCVVTAQVDVPGLAIVKTADRSIVLPGDTVNYTVTLTNTGGAEYLGATFTDSMAGALDDADRGPTFNADAPFGMFTYLVAGLEWTGDLQAGETVVIRYALMVSTVPEAGDGTMVNRVFSAAPGSTCPPGSASAGCLAVVTVVKQELTITTSASSATTAPGAAVVFSVVLHNTGQITLDGDVTIGLSGVLDDGVVGTVGAGAAFSNDQQSLLWTGGLLPDETATVTLTVDIALLHPGDGVLTIAATSTTPGNNCPAGTADPACFSTVTVTGMVITSGFTVASAIPGQTAGFFVNAVNTGGTPLPGISIDVNLTSTLDDAIYNGDAAAFSGSFRMLRGGKTLRWTGDLGVGQSVDITGSVTVSDPDPGDSFMAFSIESDASDNCRPGEVGAGCGATIYVMDPHLTIVKSADTAVVAPGGTIGYTITVTNSGNTVYTGAAVTDGLGTLLGGATYNTDATATTGVVDYNAPNLTWTGDLNTGDSVTITYTVTVNDPRTATTLTNAVFSTADGSSCRPGRPNPDCVATVQIVAPQLSIITTADADSVTLGDMLSYTVTVTNTGQTPYLGATFTENLTGVLDDAVYNVDASADRGTLTYAQPVFTWTGDLEVGDTAVILYSVQANFRSGDHLLIAAIDSASPGSNCPSPFLDSGCSAIVTLALPGLAITNVADVSTAVAGDIVGFTTTISNEGPAPYTGVSVTIGSADAADDASSNDDQVADSGTLTITGATTTWTGDVPAGGTVTITASMTVEPAHTGDRTIVTTATSDVPGSNCPSSGPGPECVASVAVLDQGLSLVLTADTRTTTPGGTVTYTITATNNGQPAYAGTTVTDSLQGLLNDATYNGDAAASSGTVSYATPNLTWTGDLATGDAVTITYSVTVGDSPLAGRTLTNFVTSGAAGSSCPAEGAGPACYADVDIIIPGLTLTKTADTAVAQAGSTVTYTVTMLNAGQSPYTTATFTDSLAGVLDDAAYGNDATATTGSVSYAAPELTWEGGLTVGQSVVVVYSVTVNLPATGDHVLVGTVTSTTAGATCPVSTPCTGTVAVVVPELTIASTADTAEVATGGVVHYSIVVTNTGGSAYTGARVTASLTGVLDDGSYDGSTATTGDLTYAAPDLRWTGDLPAGAAAVIEYTVTAHNSITGDGHLATAVTSVTGNCPAGTTDADCASDVTIVATSITLSSLPGESALEGGTSATTGENGLLTMTVVTNSPTGYLVTVRSTVDDLTAASPGNSDTIPIENVRVRETGTQNFEPLSSTAAVVVHDQPTPSTAGGDAISTDYEVSVPFVTPDTYSAPVEYVAITQ